MRVVYIVGMGRSGSTLLDLLLDAHSEVCSLGGVRRLTNALTASCPCGVEDRYQCNFWGAVNTELHRMLGSGLDAIDPSSDDDATFRRHNRALFAAAERVSGNATIVDSSKSVSRLARLMTHLDIEIYPVHIMRDPRGYVASQRKRKTKRIAPAWSYVGRSLRTYSLLRNVEHSAVAYEALALRPEESMQQLMERLGLPFESQQLFWAEQIHHNIGGGAVLKRTKGNAIQPDYSWHWTLPKSSQALIKAISFPGDVANAVKARRWGLDVRDA